jgi:hypothetical protein
MFHIREGYRCPHKPHQQASVNWINHTQRLKTEVNGINKTHASNQYHQKTFDNFCYNLKSKIVPNELRNIDKKKNNFK